jgi:hypothetical protein
MISLSLVLSILTTSSRPATTREREKGREARSEKLGELNPNPNIIQ